MDIRFFRSPARTFHEDDGQVYLVEFTSAELGHTSKRIQDFEEEGRLDKVVACQLLAGMSRDDINAVYQTAKLHARSEFTCFECEDRPSPHQEGTRIYRLPDRRDYHGPYAQFLVITPDGVSKVIPDTQVRQGMTETRIDSLRPDVREKIASEMIPMTRPQPLSK